MRNNERSPLIHSLTELGCRYSQQFQEVESLSKQVYLLKEEVMILCKRTFTA